MTGQPGWGTVVPGSVDANHVSGLLKDPAAEVAAAWDRGSLSPAPSDIVAPFDDSLTEDKPRITVTTPQPPHSPASVMQLSPRTAVGTKTQRSSWVDRHVATQSELTYHAGQDPCRGLLRRIVNSTTFSVLSTSLICLNSVIMGIETEYGDDTAGWVIVEIIFLAFYSLELFVRLGAYGLKAASQDRWIYFDGVIVVISCVDVCIIEPLSGQADARTMALVLRTLRLMKLARVIRLLRFFRELWLLVSSFISAFKTLTWTFLLLIMVIYVFGIIFVRLLGKETNNVALQEFFGTLPGAMFTLFQIATLEGWPDITRMVWETDQWYMSFVIVVFLMVTTFSIMNTVLAVIVEHTLSEAIEQRADMIKKNQAQLHHIVEMLADVYKRSDTNNDGMLSKDEFVQGIMHPKTRKLLHGMELGDDFTCLDAEELGILFDTIDVDDSHELTPQEFIKGLVQMRGSAKARGVFELRCDMSKATRKLQESLQEVQEQVKKQREDIVALDTQRREDFKAVTELLDDINAKLDRARVR